MCESGYCLCGANEAGVVFGSGLDSRFRGLVAGGAGKVGALPYPRIPDCRFRQVAVLSVLPF